MADISFEEECPCGATIKVSGYASAGVRDHIASWHNLHNKHSNSIAKAIVEAKSQPVKQE
jgi:hypothetical protein